MDLMSLLVSPEAWLAFFTLTALELVLGIDNVIFISILVDRLPAKSREKTRTIGLFFAMFMRIGLLLLLSWIVGATDPLFSVLGRPFSPRDIILIFGGLFLLWKSTQEIHELLEGNDEEKPVGEIRAGFVTVVAQIIVIDLVFSLDSIITAVGMVQNVGVMIAAVVASVGLMVLFSRAVGEFVSSHPSVKMLALAFLLVIGLTLVADGLGHHVPKGYIYFAMVFSLVVELLNLRVRKKQGRPVRLHESLERELIDD